LAVLEAKPAAPATSRTAPTAVRLVAISKRFGTVQANRDVTLAIPEGTVHGIVGENGAGKSTLMSILYGYYTADSGHIEVQGQAVSIRNSHDAIALGIGMVHQHFMLVENLSALDNVLLGVEPHFDLKRSQQETSAKLNMLMQDTGLHVNLSSLVEDLSVGDKQRLEILKALHRGARILILDEPTAVLTAQETDQLFAVLRRLRDQGKTIILITHKLREVLALCNGITVMRGGQVVHECQATHATVEELAEAMVGRKLRSSAQRREHPLDTPLQLQVQNLNYTDEHGLPRLKSVQLHIRAGEILGIAGVAGNGQSQLLEILSGIRKPTSGSLSLLGQNFSASQWISPTTARDLGLAHVPEDRHERGLVMAFGAWESAVLGYQALARYCKGLWMRASDIHQDTQAMMQRFDVRPPQPDLRSSKFSGGNQQKLILAREFNHAPKVLLVGQPTRGVDIGAIEFIHAQLRSLRDAGCSILLVSSELEEILALSDRVMVMNHGQFTGELPVQDCNERNLGLLMVSQDAAASQTASPALAQGATA
jgi:general nucleoside transport system ATP-binding protein